MSIHQNGWRERQLCGRYRPKALQGAKGGRSARGMKTGNPKCPKAPKGHHIHLTIFLKHPLFTIKNNGGQCRVGDVFLPGSGRLAADDRDRRPNLGDKGPWASPKKAHGNPCPKTVTKLNLLPFLGPLACPATVQPGRRSGGGYRREQVYLELKAKSFPI